MFLSWIYIDRVRFLLPIGIVYRVITIKSIHTYHAPQTRKQKAIVLCDRNRKFYIARIIYVFFASFPFKTKKHIHEKKINLDWMSLKRAFTLFVFISSFIIHTIQWDWQLECVCVCLLTVDCSNFFFIAQSRFLPETCLNVLEMMVESGPTPSDLCIRLIVSQKSIYYDCSVLWIEMSTYKKQEIKRSILAYTNAN